MLRDAQQVVQTAIYTALTTNIWFVANNISVFDMVPKQTTVAFVTIGDMTTVDNSTVGVGGQVITLTIHSWDQSESRARLKTMMAQVIASLHDQTLSLSDPTFTWVNSRFQSSQVLKDPDGYTVHGVQKFRIVVES